MKFAEWIKTNKDKNYTEILKDIVDVEDVDAFTAWCDTQRMGGHKADWAMLAIYVLDQRLRVLEGEKKKDKK